MIIRRPVVALVVLCLVVASAIFAYRSLSTSTPEFPEIFGVVQDRHGRPLPDVLVCVVGRGVQCRSGSDGSFRLPAGSDDEVLYAAPDLSSVSEVIPDWKTVRAGGGRVTLELFSGPSLRFRLEVPGRRVVGTLWGDFDEAWRWGVFDGGGRLDFACLPMTLLHSGRTIPAPCCLMAQDVDSGDCALVAVEKPEGQELPVSLSAPLELRGVVRMPEGARLRGVRIIHPRFKVRQAQIISPDRFVFPALPVTTYEVEAEVDLQSGEQIFASADATPGTPVELEVHR
jgi:hypothetical protein